VFARTRYIDWAIAHYGKAKADLASSGMPLRRLDAAKLAELDLDAPDAHTSLTAKIALYNDVPVTESLATLGTSQALFTAYATLLSPGDDVLVEAPGYEPLRRAAEGVGARVREVERPRRGGYALDPDRFASMMTPRTRVLSVTHLHNPSGVAADPAALLELARIAEARGAWLLVDEVYAPFAHPPVQGVFTRSARKIHPNVVAVGSLTKCFGLGMHRVGWMLGPASVIRDAQATLISTCGHLPSSHAAIGASLLADVGEHWTTTCRALEGRRAIVDGWLARHPKLELSAHPTGIFGLLHVPGAGDLLPHVERWIEERGLLVAAGSFFGAPDGLRLSWATLGGEALSTALDALADGLAEAGLTIDT
jgi:aspartate/methionine/tyrosine aminotransferase